MDSAEWSDQSCVAEDAGGQFNHHCQHQHGVGQEESCCKQLAENSDPLISNYQILQEVPVTTVYADTSSINTGFNSNSADHSSQAQVV